MKKIIAFSLAVVMSALTLTACSGGNDTAPPPAESAVEPTPASTPSADLAPTNAPTFGVNEARALAKSRWNEGYPPETGIDDLLTSYHLTVEEQAYMLYTELSNPSSDAISNGNLTRQEYEMIYAFLAEHAGKEDVTYPDRETFSQMWATNYHAGELSEVDIALFNMLSTTMQNEQTSFTHSYFSIGEQAAHFVYLEDYRTKNGTQPGDTPPNIPLPLPALSGVAVADNTGGDSSSTADEDKRTFDEGFNRALLDSNTDSFGLEYNAMLLDAGFITEEYFSGYKTGFESVFGSALDEGKRTFDEGFNDAVDVQDVNSERLEYSAMLLEAGIITEEYYNGYKAGFESLSGSDTSSLASSNGSTTSTPTPSNNGNNTPNGKAQEEKLQEAINSASFAEEHGKALSEIYKQFSSSISFQDNTKRSRYFNANLGQMPEYNGYAVFGELVNGVPDGYCRLEKITGYRNNNMTQTSAGDIIEGTFVGGKLNGRGIILADDITVIKGNFVDGMPSGDVQIIDSNGQYTGKYTNGKFNGVGEFNDAEGNIWSGEWVDGKLNGYGTFHDASNATNYKGFFVDNVLQGAGYVSNINPKNVLAGTECVGEAWGFFKDFEMTDVYGYHELTQEEKSAIKREAAAVYEYVTNMTTSTIANIMKTANESDARILKYKEDLIKVAPRPQIKLFQNWGFDEEGLFISGY